MEIQGEMCEHKQLLIMRGWQQMKKLLCKCGTKVRSPVNGMIKLGQDDPRRITHSIKMGFALTLVSFLYYSTPLYDGFGVSGMWAVLTVVVVFEFTVGGTLSRCLNRGLATMAAGALGVGAQHFARLFGEVGEPIVLGTLVFLLAAVSTFTRFFPRVKARYDYGVMIFILTFSLVSISGYRVGDILDVAQMRILTIVVGGVICILISVFVFPVWAGEELHCYVASNIEKLAIYLQGCDGICIHSTDDDKCSRKYKAVLSSKSTEENLANLARWELGRGKFSRNHHLKEYLKIGSIARECAYQIEALNCYVNSDLNGYPEEFRSSVKELREQISEEASKALKSLVASMRTITKPVCACTHVENAKMAMNGLREAIRMYPLQNADIVPPYTVVSILIEIVSCVEKLSGLVHELSNFAKFKQPDLFTISKKFTVLNSVDHVVDLDSANKSNLVKEDQDKNVPTM